MKILITGAAGMLGTDLALRLAPKHQVFGVGRQLAPHISIPFQPVNLAVAKKTLGIIESTKPDMVLHAASMTEVDHCETERRAALSDNLEATRNVTEASNRLGAMVIYFGTDFVFDGTKSEPYREDDVPNPISVYGETKLLAERYIQLRAKRFLILRTSWLFGRYGDNFPKKILRQAESGKPMQVVSDQFGNPTFTEDLAESVDKIIDAISVLPGVEKLNQIYHVTNQGRVSRFEFARAILAKRNLSQVSISPVSSDEMQWVARRPRNSALSTEKVKQNLGIQLRPWENALEAYLQEELESFHK